MSELPIRRLGEFELIRELGRGGMGVVYEAVQSSLGRRVALKVLADGLGLTATAAERFRREAATAAKLHHTNIVPVYATGSAGETLFYAMELIDGPSLDQVLRHLRDSQGVAPIPSAGQTVAYDGPVKVAEASGLGTSSFSSGTHYFDAVALMMASVADALDYAHRQGVLHRDVKPANLLLADGRLSLNDFGLARMLEEPGMTVTGEFLGTPAYASPEQITGGRVPIDLRTDVYSLGATLYELLTLRPPFVGTSRDQVLAQILHKDPIAPRTVNSKVPVDLETICVKALDKDPDRRYQTAGAFAADLRRYVNRFAIEAKRAGPISRLVKWIKRKPGLAAALGALLLAFVAIGFFGWQSYQQGEQRRDDQRRAALDKALTAALVADFAGAKQATAEAQRLGAQDWEVWLLNGYLNFHAGRTKEAAADFQQAVELRPDSVMAQALLCYAYSNLSEWSKAYDVLHKLEPMTPRTSEDRLFKGVALAFIVPERGLFLIDQAIQERPSAIAYLLRASPRTLRATDTAAIADAEAAVDDVAFAKRLLPANNPVVLCTNVQAQLAAATAFRIHGLPGRSEEALIHAERDAEALKEFPDVVEAISAREWLRLYRDHLSGRVTDMVAEFRAARERTGNDIMLWSEGLNLFWLGRDAEALTVLESNRRGTFSDFLRIGLLREAHESKDQALAALDQIQVKVGDPDRWAMRHIQLLLLGECELAAREARTFRASGQKFEIWLQPELGKALLDYYANDGSIAEGDLLKASRNRRTIECSFCFSIGLRHLANGERDEAKAMFRRSADTYAVGYTAWEYSLAFLMRMERDPIWPRWISSKK